MLVLMKGCGQNWDLKSKLHTYIVHHIPEWLVEWFGTMRISGDFLKKKWYYKKVCNLENVTNIFDVDVPDGPMGNCSFWSVKHLEG